MGLGPPVCDRCHIMAHLNDEKGWHCRYCGETENLGHTWSINIMQAYYQNEKVLRFFRGEDPDAPIGP